MVTFALTGDVNIKDVHHPQESLMLKQLGNNTGTDVRLLKNNSKKNTTYMEDT